MTKDEALDLALDWLVCYKDKSMSRNNAEELAEELITAIKQARSAPVQEPVAWRYTDSRGHYRYRGYVPGFDVEYSLLKPQALYTTPPAAQRPDVDALVALARADEREACAKVCESIGDYDENVDEYYSDIYAAAIRARGNT
jgi:hypothetical protein